MHLILHVLLDPVLPPIPSLSLWAAAAGWHALESERAALVVAAGSWHGSADRHGKQERQTGKSPHLVVPFVMWASQIGPQTYKRKLHDKHAELSAAPGTGVAMSGPKICMPPNGAGQRTGEKFCTGAKSDYGWWCASVWTSSPLFIGLNFGALGLLPPYPAEDEEEIPEELLIRFAGGEEGDHDDVSILHAPGATTYSRLSGSIFAHNFRKELLNKGPTPLAKRRPNRGFWGPISGVCKVVLLRIFGKDE